MFALLLAVTFSFHMKLTDGKTALLANPDFEKLHMPAEQLEGAAKDRVVMLDRTTGAHWIWLMFSWKTEKEVFFGLRGSADPKKNEAYVGLTPNENGTIRVRCLQAPCRVDATTLAQGESKDVSAESDVMLTFG